MFKTFYLFLLLSVENVLCANILYVSTMHSRSHHVWNRAFAIGLVNQGHNVTLADPDIDKLPKPARFTHVLLEGVYEEFNITESDIKEYIEMSALRMLYEYEKYCIIACKKCLESKGMQTILNYPPEFKFDLIVIDVTPGACAYPIIHRFGYPPAVAVTPFLLPSSVSYNFGNYFYPTYLPWYGLNYSSNMTFMERVWNYICTHVETANRYLRQFKSEHEIAKTVFGEDIPSMEDLERHISLVLANTDPILDYPQPLTPNVIGVGGLHAKNAEKLPQDLQTIVENARNGVIVFSLGTNIRSDQLGTKTRKALLDAFGKIKETVLWKFESDIDDLPKNVIVRKWLPQNDLLGHSNVKLFIGHGGALSTQEAVFHGVPMICVPFVVDQHLNARMVVRKKVGLLMDFKSITTSYVLQEIREVLDNPIYAQNMKKTSAIFKDRIETPLQRAVFWTEYVLRHGGADFLNSPARDLPFYVTSGLDVVAFLVFTFVLILITVFKIIACVLSLFLQKKKVKVS